MATPAVCFGVNTTCTIPTLQPLELGPESTCTATEPGSPTIVWQRDLQDLGCAIGHCAPVVATIAVDHAGGLWATAPLVVPGPDVYMGAAAFGTALVAYDGAGKRRFAEVADFRTRLSGNAAASGGLFPDSRGHVRWVAPTTGAPGLELRDYAPDGTLAAAHRLVDSVRDGTAMVGEDGSAILAYHYSDLGIQDAGGSDPGYDTDVARFDATGHVVWNQVASRVLGLGKADRFTVAISPELDAVMLAGLVEADVGPARAVLARLDADGNVTWVRDMENALLSNPVMLPGGAVVFGFMRTDDASAQPRLVKVDADGNAIWNLSMDTFGFGGPSITVVDGEGRLWGTSFGVGGTTSIVAVTDDGKSCASWPLQAPTCATGADGSTYCSGVVVSPAAGGGLYFGGALAIGRANLGGLP